MSKSDKTDRSDDELQGEGNYTAAEEYDEDVREFVKRGDVEKAARDAEPDNEREKREMEKAEAEGRSHAHNSPGK